MSLEGATLKTGTVQKAENHPKSKNTERVRVRFKVTAYLGVISAVPCFRICSDFPPFRRSTVPAFSVADREARSESFYSDPARREVGFFLFILEVKSFAHLTL